MPMNYIASNWYWNVAGSSIYSSAAGMVISISTAPQWATYQTWLATAKPTPIASFALLDDVLAAAGLPITGQTPLTTAQLQQASWTKLQSLLANVRSYTITGVTGTVAADGGSVTTQSLQALNAWGTANPTATVQWVDDNYNVFTLTGAQAVSLGDQVFAYAQSVYAVLATVAAAITAGTMTTVTQIDGAAWPV